MMSVSDLIRKVLPEIESVELVEVVLEQLPQWVYRFRGVARSRIVEGVAEVVWSGDRPSLTRMEIVWR